jgi:hypothetical protein
MPEFSVVMRQGLVFIHLLLFATAVAEILKEDVRLLLGKKINFHALHITAKFVLWSLLGLWASGVLLIVNQYGLDLSKAFANPKIATKIAAVVLLSLNGVALHYFVFPMMVKNQNSVNFTATVATIFGAISTTSWLFASFVGAARYIASYMNLQYFLALYAASLFAGVCVGLLLVRSRIASSLHEAQLETLKSLASGDREKVSIDRVMKAA